MKRFNMSTPLGRIHFHVGTPRGLIRRYAGDANADGFLHVGNRVVAMASAHWYLQLEAWPRWIGATDDYHQGTAECENDSPPVKPV